MAVPSHERELKDLIAADPWRCAALRAAASLDLPDAWIGAGFVRAPVWDRLHGYNHPTPLDDIDVIYHDPADLSEAAERRQEARLEAILPCGLWSVRNQARMHLRNKDLPYSSSEDALRHWLETPTAVALRCGKHGGLDLLAPFGLTDLFNMVIRPTPHAKAQRYAAFRVRVGSKNWLTAWPQVRVVED